MYDRIYLDDFEARVIFRQGLVSIRAQSPVCASDIKTFIMRDPDVLVVDIHESALEPVEREITLSRWGSRHLFHYFYCVHQDTTLGLSGTTSGSGRSTIWIEQKLNRISFAVAARFVGAPVKTSCPNSHSAQFTTPAEKELHGQLYLAVVTSEDHPQPLAEARRRVDKAVLNGYKALYQKHIQRWAEFWSRSFIRIPDAYLENLYYFSLYQAGCSSGGAYPPIEHGGLWMWNHDAMIWGTYYHWNMQQMVWPLYAAGHLELASGYYHWRFNSLAGARETAQRIHGIEGAFFTDVSDRDGRQATNGKTDTHLSYNLTPGSQIAMDFWRHYQYTGDKKFLREKAYPMMKEAATFYLNYMVRDDQGIYHVPASTGYEAHLKVKDCVADLVVIRASFEALIRACSILKVDQEFKKQVQHALDHLAEIQIVEENGQPVIVTGIALTNEPGISYEVKRSYKKDEALFYQGFWQSMSPAFPNTVVGLSQRGTPIFEAARNSVRLLGPTSAGGWIPSAVFAARLGMEKEALEWLAWYVNFCQLFPQGFMQEGPYGVGSTNIWDAREAVIIQDGVRTDKKTHLLMRDYDIPAPECNTNLMLMIQEMLFQSHDGILRCFPATPDAWGEASFHLHAVGGFEVTAERTQHTTAYIKINSLLGNICKLANPWQDSMATVIETTSGNEVCRDSSREITFPTQPGAVYWVRPSAQVEQGKPVPSAKFDAPPPGPRQAYGRMLGVKRYF